MTYATQQNLVDRFGAAEIQQLSDIGNSGSIDAARVGRVLTDASNKIDGYLASRYALPLSTVPPMLEQICCDLARYLLATRPTEETRKRYEDALAWLDKVAQGKYDLGGASSVQPPIAGGAIGIAPGGRTFTSDSLNDFLTGPKGLGSGGFGQ